MKRGTAARLRHLSNLPNHFPTVGSVAKLFDERAVFAVIFLSIVMILGTSEIQQELQNQSPSEVAQRVVQQITSIPALGMVIIGGVICALLTVLSLWRLGYLGGLRLLRDHGDYERNDPVPGVHPAVVSRLWNGCALLDDVVVALLSLADKGAVKLREIPKKTPGYSKSGIDIAIQVVDAPGVLQDPLDALLYSFLMNESADGERTLALSSLLGSGSSRSDSLCHRMFVRDFFVLERELAIQSGLFMRRTLEMGTANYAEKSSIDDTAWKAILTCSVMSPALFLLLLFLSESVMEFAALPVVRWFPFLPWVVYFLCWVLFDMRRTAAGRRVLARCRKLKRWLKDFTLLAEAEPSAVTAWGPYAVYAYVLDISEVGMKRLRSLGVQVDRVALAAVSSDSWFSSQRDEMADYHRLIQGEPVTFPDEIEKIDIPWRDLFRNGPAYKRMVQEQKAKKAQERVERAAKRRIKRRRRIEHEPDEVAEKNSD